MRTGEGQVLRVSSHLTSVFFLILLTVSCGSGNNVSALHSTEAGTTPVSASVSDSFHGTYRLSGIYSGDLSIVRAEGVQYVDSVKNTVRIELEIDTLLDSYKIEREYPIEFGKSSFAMTSGVKEKYESENSSSEKSYFIDTQYLAEMSDFQALLNIEWQKISDKTGGKI
ncbi:hypothetical protein EP073_05965 [Geovibrio thiophilus]|uniref:Uncharacterized protein n=1 Tax=Geovibrio thiophilus TaxID=139438 RepID=A0A3R5X2J2_9BACT|nr:hypothetical protein [Geovibrio thiophilus]QAR32969.1 hypothetical protein EP073_05965 [Geovibrio thiophilus]